jgi:hypothetical protein
MFLLYITLNKNNQHLIIGEWKSVQFVFVETGELISMLLTPILSSVALTMNR